MTKDEQMRLRYIELAVGAAAGSAVVRVAEQIKAFVEPEKAKK